MALVLVEVLNGLVVVGLQQARADIEQPVPECMELRGAMPLDFSCPFLIHLLLRLLLFPNNTCVQRVHLVDVEVSQ
eukprot:768066-Hanusia_phi.AAC.9